MPNPIELSQMTSDQAISVAYMKSITPPEGARIYVGNIKGQQGAEYGGVKEMAEGLIQTFQEERGRNPEYVKGTFISYEPGTIYAHVTRRGLSGEDVNKINSAITQTEHLLHQLNFLPTAISGAENFITDLREPSIRGFKSAELPRTEAGTLDTTALDMAIGKSVEQLGLLLKTMREQLPTLNMGYTDLLKQLDLLGVSLFVGHTTLAIRGGIAVPLALRNRRALAAAGEDQALVQ